MRLAISYVTLPEGPPQPTAGEVAALLGPYIERAPAGDGHGALGLAEVPRRRLAALVFVVGAASLGGEIAAARLLAPWFGASTLIWANTIATVLLALSVGYWLGGRLADRHPSLAATEPDRARRRRAVRAGAVRRGAVPRVAVEALESVSAGAFVGSLIAVLVLIALPMLLLGTVAPYAIRLAVERVEEAGRVAGRLYAVSTLGSLAGVFLSALVLIPFLGTRRTFLVFALALAVAAAASLGRRSVLAPVALAALIAIPVGTVKATEDGRVIWERETPYQYARVVEAADGKRRLELNEGLAVHSVYRARALADRQLLGRVPRAAVRRARRRAALGRDPRQRGRHDGARLRPLLPAHAGRRRSSSTVR